LETGFEQLLGVENQEAERDCGQEIQRTALTVEPGADHVDRKAGGGARAGSLPAGQQRVKPPRRHRDQQSQRLRHETSSQQEQEEGGQDCDVGAGDDECVKGAGRAVVVGPDSLQLIGLTDEDSLHDSTLVGVAVVEALDALQGGLAHVHDGFLESRAAPARQDPDRAGGAGCRPVDVVAGEVAGIVEGAGVAVIAGLAHAGIEFHVLSVVQRRQRLVAVGVQGHLSARAGVEFEQEALALARNGGGLDHAPAEDDDLAPLGVQFRRRGGGVGESGQDAGRDEAKQARGSGQDTGVAEQRQHAQQQKRGDGAEKFRRLKRYEAGNQDPCGNGSYRPHQREFHWKPDCNSRRCVQGEFSRQLTGTGHFQPVSQEKQVRRIIISRRSEGCHEDETVKSRRSCDTRVAGGADGGRPTVNRAAAHVRSRFCEGLDNRRLSRRLSRNRFVDSQWPG